MERKAHIILVVHAELLLQKPTTTIGPKIYGSMHIHLKAVFVPRKDSAGSGTQKWGALCSLSSLFSPTFLHAPCTFSFLASAVQFYTSVIRFHCFCSLPNLNNCLSRTSALHQRRIQNGGTFRCLCSVAFSEPSTSDTSSSSVK